MNKLILTFPGMRPREAYDIFWDLEVIAARDAEYCHETTTIGINPNIDPVDFWRSFIHEVVHTAETSYQMKLCEAEVEIIATHVSNALFKYLPKPLTPPKSLKKTRKK